jgi:hypothetical protein
MLRLLDREERLVFHRLMGDAEAIEEGEEVLRGGGHGTSRRLTAAACCCLAALSRWLLFLAVLA